VQLGHAGDAEAREQRRTWQRGKSSSSGDTIPNSEKIGNSLREDVRWTYAVHERTLPAVRRVNAPVRWTEVTVRHTGYTDPALRERKLQRDCKILESELAEARRLWRMVQGACPDDVEATARSDP